MWIILFGFFCVCFVVSAFVSDSPFIDALKLMLFLFGVGFIVGSFWFLGVLFFENLESKRSEVPEAIEYSGSLAHNQCYDYALKKLEGANPNIIIDDLEVTNSVVYLECMGQ